MIEPSDGSCKAVLYIADDFGDNSATIRCEVYHDGSGIHDGPHRQEFKRGDYPVVITWYVDERCDSCWADFCGADCLAKHECMGGDNDGPA